MVFPLLSSFAIILLGLGLFLRREPALHIPLMLSAFGLDLGMVLWLEFNRAAVEQVAAGVTGLLAFHVIVSTLVMVLYIALIWSGRRLWLGHPASRKLHRILAVTFIIGRLINYVTAFFVGSA